MCLLSILGEVNETFMDAEKYATRQKQMTELVNKVLMQGLSEGKKVDDILQDVYTQLKNSNIE